ncbi:MAG: LysR substrate-binding domain-containing protein, partial [Solirubrobacteraceae bacterium]
ADHGVTGIIELAPAGTLVYPQAHAALTALARIPAAVADHLAAATLELDLAASHTIGDALLSGWLLSFGRDRPQVRPTIEIVNSPGVLQALRVGRVSIGFVEGDDAIDDMTSLPVATDEILVTIAPSHRWSARTSIAPSELLSEPYIARESGSGTRAVAESALAGTGVALTPSLQVDSAEALKRALSAGGFTLLSTLVTEQETRARTLLRLPVRGLAITRTLWACHPAGVTLNGAAADFWTWLSNHACLPTRS